MQISEFAQVIAAAFPGQSFIVGGAVRDFFMDRAPKDFDMMVVGITADEIESKLAQIGVVDFTGKDFGVFRVRRDDDEIEVAMPRIERSIGVGHKDFEVRANHSISVEDDLSRRDFTVNAMAFHIDSGQFIDPFSGCSDIESGIVRAVSEQSFSDDPLRIMRAMVMIARFDFAVDPITQSAMAEHRQAIRFLPAERIADEIDKMFSAANPAAGIRAMHDIGIMEIVFPEIEATVGFDQNNAHHESELFDHMVSVLERVSERVTDADVRIASMMHDIGKPASEWKDEQGMSHFYRNPNGQGQNHAEVGAEMVRARLNELHFSSSRINRISALVAHHMFDEFTTEKGARRFINAVSDHADDLIEIRRADMSKKRDSADPDVSRMVELVKAVRASNQATNRFQLAITGADVIATGIPQGPMVGRILQQVVDIVIDNPSMNDHDHLIAVIHQIKANQQQTRR